MMRRSIVSLGAVNVRRSLCNAAVMPVTVVATGLLKPLLLLLVLLGKTTALSCESGWELYNGYCYRFFEEHMCLMTDNDCEMRCRLNGGQLASIHSEAENEFIYNLKLRGPYASRPHYTPGIRRLGGTFYNTDMTPVDYTKWMAGYPDNKGGQESCVYISQSAVNNPRYWEDFRCSDLVRRSR